MPWSGANFTRVHDWGADAGSAIDIEASRMDAEDDNFQAGIEACLNKAGLNSMTGDLNLGGNDIINALSIEIQDAGATDTAVFSHDGTDFNTALTNTTDWNITGATAVRFSSIVDVRDGSAFTVRDSTNADNAAFSHDGADFNTAFTNTLDWNISALTGWIRVIGASGLELQDGGDLVIRDSTDADSVTFGHTGTDFNSSFVGTTAWNITGLTSIQAGTVDVDFDAVTATSYGGITEANLVDKSASETISGAWGFAAITATSYDGIAAANLLDKTASETISGVWTIGGVSAFNLVDKTAAETISGVYNFTAQPTISGDDIPAKTEGSFTLNWAGFTTAESTTVYYTKVDDLVTLWFVGSASGTSNLGTLTSGFEIPVAIRPPRSASHIIEVQNNGTWENGRISLQSTGTVSITRNGGSAFTTSGTKSFLNDMNFSYTINPNIV